MFPENTEFVSICKISNLKFWQVSSNNSEFSVYNKAFQNTSIIFRDIKFQKEGKPEAHGPHSLTLENSYKNFKSAF